MPYRPGTQVTWDADPIGIYTVIEFQSENGSEGAYLLANHRGEAAVALAEDLGPVLEYHRKCAAILQIAETLNDETQRDLARALHEQSLVIPADDPRRG